MSDRDPLLASSFYVANLGRAAESLEITVTEPLNVPGEFDLAVGRPLERPELERASHLMRTGGAAPRCVVRDSLGQKQLADRVRAMLKRQSDVRKVHEKAGFTQAWAEIENRIEVPEALGGLLAVMATVRPTLFSQSLLGGYLASLLAWEMRMSVPDRVSAFMAGLCRDLGMLYINPRILDDASDQHFDGEAWTEVQTHVVISHRIVELVGMRAEVAEAVLSHHERSDSTGYPRALWEREVPILGQLIGFCDITSTLRVKRFFGSGRNLRDALTVLQLNTDSFDDRIGHAFGEVLGRAKLKPTAFCPHDRDTMLRILKRRATTIRSSLLQLQEVFEDRRCKRRSPQGHILRASVARMLSNLQRSGHSDQDFVWWLGLVAAGKESADMHQLAEIDLQQEELLWQLRRVRQELFKAVPSLAYQSSAVAI